MGCSCDCMGEKYWAGSDDSEIWSEFQNGGEMLQDGNSKAVVGQSNKNRTGKSYNKGGDSKYKRVRDDYFSTHDTDKI